MRKDNLQGTPVSCGSVPISLKTGSIEYAPEGTHTITATANGNPAQMTLTIDESLVERLNADLESWKESSNDGFSSRPFIDFDHKGEAAAAIPKEFFWKDGLRLSVEWTEAGKSAIEGRNYSYFSPELIVDRDSGSIIGLPYFGSIGSLVNSPAFQQIERLAAAKQNQKPPIDMTIEQLTEKLTAAEAEQSETLKKVVDLQASLEAVSKERDDSVQKIEASTTELEGLKKDFKSSEESHKSQAEKIETLRTEKITASIELKGVKEEKREGLLKACLAQADDGDAILAAFETPAKKIAGVPPIEKNKQQNQKQEEEPSGFERLTAGIQKQLEEKGLIHA
tara:strand:+ start:7611 stop:8624 length:1014 start_codon:yes stop_codon:yes gene_type:complete